MTTEQEPRAKHVQPGQGKTFRARGDLFFFKVVGTDNNDAFSMCEVWNAPQGGVLRTSTTSMMRRSSS